MKLKIIQIGKTKEAWLSEALAEYQKRLKPYCEMQSLQLKERSLKEGISPAKLRELEAEALLAKLSPDDYVIALDEAGDSHSSLEFSQYLIKLSTINKNLVFVIGGAFGLGAALLARADKVLSLSRLTFTHQMVRLVLVEQIYRAMMIKAGKKYHIE